MGFADALDVLGGNSSAPPPQDPTASSGNGPLRFTVHPRGEGRSEPTGSFGGALSILNGDATPEPPKETPKRDIGGAESFATGLKSGLTANFSDEIAGASAAGRSMLPDEAKNVKLSPLGEIIAAAGGAARMGYEALTGGNTGSDAYTKARDAERENQRLAAEQHPIANAAGNITGALALPIGGAASAATLPGRMAAGAGLGAGMGGAFGAGEGETLADRASRAGTGALIGGATGGVAPAILSGVGKAAGAVSDTAGSLLGHPIQTLRGLRNPDEEAARRVGTAIKGDMAAGRAGMSAVDARAAEASGQPLAVIDAGGENTRALARSAANTSPQGRAALEGMAQERFNSQNERTAEFARSLVPTPGNATRTAEAIDKAEAAANRPGYRIAYAAGDRPINSPEISRLMGSPDVVQAMKEAAEKGKSKAIADGFGAFNPGVKVTDDGQVLFQKGKGGVPTYPNIQFWDYTYRALRDKGRSLTQNGNRDEGNTLTQLSKQLRKELDEVVPEYGKARGVASEFFQAENALEAGQKFVGMRVPIEEAKAAHAKMTAPQKALFAEGFVSDLADKVSKIADNRSVVIDKIFNSPDGRARVELALGKDKAKDLEYFLRRESMMDMVRKAMGNSTTARQMAEMGLAGGLSGAAGGAGEAMMTGHMDAKTLLSAALVGGAVAGHRAINFKVAQRVGEMLASDDPKVLATALKMVKTNPDAGRAMIRAEKIMEKLSGQGAGSAPPILPAISAGRADEQQQQ